MTTQPKFRIECTVDLDTTAKLLTILAENQYDNQEITLYDVENDEPENKQTADIRPFGYPD